MGSLNKCSGHPLYVRHYSLYQGYKNEDRANDLVLMGVTRV